MAKAVQIGKGDRVVEIGIRSEDQKKLDARYAPDSMMYVDARPSSLAEIRVGEMAARLARSYQPGRKAATVTPEKVMLLAGVEPLLTASPNATRDILGGWNVGAIAGGGQ